MKYLKRFNEELNSQTYLRASYKRKKSAEGLTGRNKENALKSAADLHDWAAKTELKEYYKDWEEKVSTYAKYGKMAGFVNDEQIDFYFDITFDSLCFSDTFDDQKSQDPDDFEATIPLCLWLAPTTKEAVDKCLKTIPSDYFGNGEFQSFYLNIDIQIKNEQITFKEFNIWPEEEVGIELTPNAGFKLKEMLIKLFSDKDFNYPSSATNYDTEYEHMNGCMCIENGLSVDYGFELSQVSDFIRTLPKQSFFK